MVSLLIFAGCGRLAPLSDNTIDTWTVRTGEFPLCVTEQLAQIPILVMDDLVKNCTEKKEEWKYRDGLGWVYPVYIIANNQVLSMSFNNDETGDRVVCQENDGTKLLIPTWVTGLTWYGDIEIPWYATTLKVIVKWFINLIADKVYPDSMRCRETYQDCMDMIDYGWWTDGQNYFVAGYRSTRNQNYTGAGTNPDLIKYYVINDKAYYPWETKESGVITESKRNFVGIQNNKIIVRRMKDWVLVGDQKTADPATLKSNFTLETCEIDL